MNVCVLGLWHLGTVTAACLATAGHQVIGCDPDGSVVADLQKGVPPLYEPGLEKLIEKELHTGNLRFTSSPADALREIDVLWVAFDTPVDENDTADVDYVLSRVRDVLPLLPEDCLVLLSSQLPVGSTRQLARDYASLGLNGKITFAYSPENLRLGKAIEVFTNPDRVVVGLEDSADRKRLERLLTPYTNNIVWMSLESAEMTKHAINAFLAMSVTFANEIATICERVGADAREVEQGLKSEARIGPRAYLSPGAAFAGGTLARDIAFLSVLGRQHGVQIQLLPSVKSSNDEHKSWGYRKLKTLLRTLEGETIAILGLTYKPGTDTLRRSSAVELASCLAEQNALVKAYDPAVRGLPSALADKVQLCDSVAMALRGASALIIATEWAEFKKVDWASALGGMKRRIVVDANRFLAAALAGVPGVEYATVGEAVKPLLI